jgi:hypothetical protein
MRTHRTATRPAPVFDPQPASRVVLERYPADGVTIEILGPEPACDRLLRKLLADGACSVASVRLVASAVGIGNDELDAAAARAGVLVRRSRKTGRAAYVPVAPLPPPEPAEPISCGHLTMWRSTRGPWRCRTCHPPATATQIDETADAPPIRSLWRDGSRPVRPARYDQRIAAITTACTS